MATKLIKPVAREITLTDEFGHNGQVVATMKISGVEFRKKGTSRKIFIPWEKLNKVAKIPSNAPSKYTLNPFGWLTDK